MYLKLGALLDLPSDLWTKVTRLNQKILVLLISAVFTLLFCIHRESVHNLGTSNTSRFDMVPCDPKVVYRQGGIRPLKAREELGDLLEEKGFEVGVEVGVQKAKNSEKLLSRWKSCATFTLVDMWQHQSNYIDRANFQQSVHNSFYEEARHRLERFGHRTKLIFYRMPSIKAAAQIRTNSTDFVYLDARHDFCAVTEDIEAYWDKLRPGGIMAGHDFYNSAEIKAESSGKQDWGVCSDGSVHPGAVRGAVEEFAAKNSLVVSVMYREPKCNSWMIQKPTTSHCVSK